MMKKLEAKPFKGQEPSANAPGPVDAIDGAKISRVFSPSAWTPALRVEEKWWGENRPEAPAPAARA